MHKKKYKYEQTISTELGMSPRELPANPNKPVTLKIRLQPKNFNSL